MLGPRRRTPCRSAIATISSWSSCSPVSAKPEGISTALGMFLRPTSSRDEATNLAGIAKTATSTSPGTSVTLLYALRPRMSSALGFTGWISPAKPPSMRLRITELPILPCSLEAPMTATDEGCISRRIEVRISSRVYVRRGFGTESARIRRMSAATAPSGVAITGLRSTSAISGKSATSWDTRRICSAIAHRSTPARPRTPRRISAALIESSMDSASSALTGASRNVTSLRTSTSTPPSPNATTFPNVGSVTAPTMTSCPCGATPGPVRLQCARTRRTHARSR